MDALVEPSRQSISNPVDPEQIVPQEVRLGLGWGSSSPSSPPSVGLVPVRLKDLTDPHSIRDIVTKQTSGGMEHLIDALVKDYSVSPLVSSTAQPMSSSSHTRSVRPSSAPSQAAMTSKAITQATSYRANFPVPAHKLPSQPSASSSSSTPPTYDRTLHTVVHSQSPYLYAVLEDPYHQEGKERQLCFGVTPASSLNAILAVTKSGFVLPPKASGSGGQVSHQPTTPPPYNPPHLASL